MPAMKDRVDQIDELEELWIAPTAPEPVLLRPELRPEAALPAVPGRLVACGWAAFFAGVLLFEPVPAEGATNPLWGDLVVAAMALMLLTAASLGSWLPRFGFAAATVGGGLGMVIAVACRTTGHHAGSWWIVELAATAALMGLAAAGLGSRLRRE